MGRHNVNATNAGKGYVGKGRRHKACTHTMQTRQGSNGKVVGANEGCGPKAMGKCGIPNKAHTQG